MAGNMTAAAVKRSKPPCCICSSLQSKVCATCLQAWYCKVCIVIHKCTVAAKPLGANPRQPCCMCLSQQSTLCAKCLLVWYCDVCVRTAHHNCTEFDATTVRRKFTDHEGVVYGHAKKVCNRCFSPKSVQCDKCLQVSYCKVCWRLVHHDECAVLDKWYMDEYGAYLWQPIWTKPGVPRLGDTIPVLLRARTAAMVAADCNGCTHQHNEASYVFFDVYDANNLCDQSYMCKQMYERSTRCKL